VGGVNIILVGEHIFSGWSQHNFSGWTYF